VADARRRADAAQVAAERQRADRELAAEARKAAEAASRADAARARLANVSASVAGASQPIRGTTKPPQPGDGTRQAAPSGPASSAGAPIVGFVPGQPLPPSGCAMAGASVAPGNWYVVRRRDSLWLIARRHYGNGHRWPAIRDANSLVGARAVIHPCQALFVPR
jgi:nucleoid-associated protein YgaU